MKIINKDYEKVNKDLVSNPANPKGDTENDKDSEDARGMPEYFGHTGGGLDGQGGLWGARGVALGWSNDDLQALESAEDIEAVHPVLVELSLLPQIPPSSNTGGTDFKHHPHSVAKQQKVGIDWLAFSAEEPIGYFQNFVNRFIPLASFFETRKGWQGYKNHYVINLHGLAIGILAYGASHGKPYLSLTGKACTEIEKSHDWDEVARVISVFFSYKLSRVDLKLDFFFKEVGHEFLKEAYKEGKFKLAKARLNPRIDPREPMNGEGQYEGRTLYVGSREGGKYFRGYEKGEEVFRKLPQLAQEQFRKSFDEGGLKPDCTNSPEGATLKDWYRMEIEYKSNDRVLPINILIERDDFFAGSYPICSEVLPMANPLRPKTLPNNLDIEESLMFKHQGDQYGAFNYSMLSKGINPIEVLRKIIEGHWGHSQRYLKAGGIKDLDYLDPDVLNPNNWTYTKPLK